MYKILLFLFDYGRYVVGKYNLVLQNICNMSLLDKHFKENFAKCRSFEFGKDVCWILIFVSDQSLDIEYWISPYFASFLKCIKGFICMLYEKQSFCVLSNCSLHLLKGIHNGLDLRHFPVIVTLLLFLKFKSYMTLRVQ